MPEEMLSRFALLPDLKLISVERERPSTLVLHAEKCNPFEVCPRCATRSWSVYDRRVVRIKDDPMRHAPVVLQLRKRRFQFKPCKKPFTEPINGISKGSRFTERFKRALVTACERYSDIKAVKEQFRCSYGFIYKSLYQQLELQARYRQSPWPHKIGIDEHRFGRDKKTGRIRFATFIVNHGRNKRGYELVEGRTVGELKALLGHIPGRDDVKLVTMDMSGPYRSFTHSFFPNAKIVADKFHVVRLLNPAINRARKEITGDRRNLPVRKLLLKNGFDLEFKTHSLMMRWLERYPKLREIYLAKEMIHRLYRCKGIEKARASLSRLLDLLATSEVEELKTLRNTLNSWRSEILNYFISRHTNARVEGFNNVAKTIIKRGYGYTCFKNYRLRVLRACC
jgi:transposase